jgi:putative ABC transport system permease protein
MFANYLKIAWRNIRRHPGYSLINFAGLALGMACCILILVWVKDEVETNRSARTNPADTIRYE